MGREPDPRAALAAAGVQCLLALTWTVYVVHLPALLSAAGLPRTWTPWVLMLDQALFVAFDWIAGVRADQLRGFAVRYMRALLAVSMGAAALLAAMPFAAQAGALPLLALGVAWSVSTSALKAPVVSMLARAGGGRPASFTGGLVVTGLGVAGALSTPLGAALRESDPRLPMGLASIALLAAAWMAARIERTCASPAPSAVAMPGTGERPGRAPSPAAGREGAAPRSAPVPRGDFGAAIRFASIAAAALAVQLHVALASDAQFRRVGAEPLVAWHPLFWIGVSLVTVPAARLLDGDRRAWATPAGWVLGALGLALSPLAPTPGWLALAQAIAGAGWGLVLANAFGHALGRGGDGRAGAAAGMVYSALALAALARLGLAVAGLRAGTALEVTVVAAWIAAAVLSRDPPRASAVARADNVSTG